VYLCDSIFVVNSLRQTFQVTLVSESQDKNNHSAEAIELFSNGVGFKTWDWDSQNEQLIWKEAPLLAEIEDNALIKKKRGEKKSKVS
jgi:hypothetical protein